MNQIIKFYKSSDPHGFLNNFFPCKFFIYGHWWNNVEAPYQFAKTDVPSEQESIVNAKTAREVRNLGQIVSLRKDWDEVKVKIMKECVFAKFTQNHELRVQLLETKDATLVENSPIDYFWGCGKDDSGKNMLGAVLMDVRNSLKE